MPPIRPPRLATEVTDEQVETACEAYADATDYYIKFHRGLSSASSDRMRVGMRTALTKLQAERS
jgi:DNA invertase Pin-like site-specific DNA recombinase